ncbi:MAG: hypothetical protein KBC48_00625 [Candidatus Pacebacteria bacterium]|nr:hypothetical protein [Candidatus Paceibacterota bacterium]
MAEGIYFRLIMTFYYSKNFWLNGSLVVGSVILVLIFTEIILRLLSPAAIIEDPILGVRGAPTEDWDENGFRNEKVLGSAKIVALGDSQTEGNNATREEAWPQVLGQLGSTTVYQMAAGGYGPVQYNYLFDQAVKKNPETIFVGLYLGNDLLDAERLVYSKDYWQEWRRDGYQSVASSTNYRLTLAYGLEPGTLAYKIKSSRDWFRNNVRVYALAGNATRGLRESLGLAKKLPESLNDVSKLSAERPDLVWVYEDEKVGTVLSPIYRLGSVDLSQDKTAEGWRLTTQALTQLAAKAKENKVRLIFNIIPTKEAVYLSYLEKSGQKIPDNFKFYWKAEQQLAQEVRALCSTLKTECIFPLADLTAALGRGEKIYGVTMDGHPLARGYAVIAESVFNYLKL